MPFLHRFYNYQKESSDKTLHTQDLLSAVTEAAKRIKTRQNAKTHFIIFTDEPGNSKYPTAGTINFLKDIPVTVSVIGTNDTFQQ